MINAMSLWFFNLFSFLYTFFFYEQIIEKKTITTENSLLAFLYKTIQNLYKEFLQVPYFPELLMNFVVLNYKFYPHIQLPYIIFNVIPRIIVAIALYVDILNLTVFYFYKALPILLVTVIYNILAKCAYDLLLQRLDAATSTFTFLWLFDESYVILSQAVNNFQEIPFSYRVDVPLKEQSNEGLNTWFTLYTVTIFLTTYFRLPRAEYLLSIINSGLIFVLFLEWWYILFYVLLNK